MKYIMITQPYEHNIAPQNHCYTQTKVCNFSQKTHLENLAPKYHFSCGSLQINVTHFERGVLFLDQNAIWRKIVRWS